jgi:hypothetical protein
MIIKPPTSNDINRIADWVELFVLSSGNSISKSKIVSVLQKDGVNIEEEDIDSAFIELGRRLQLYGTNAPYAITGNTVAPNFDWKKFPEYTLCLYYSTYGAGNPDAGTKLFEDITKICIEIFLQANSYMFGFPNNKSFKDQLDEFAIDVKEQRFQNPSPADKDRGVDVVVYKEFDAIRNNCLLIFIQCAAGKNWNDKKPVSIASYGRFLHINRKTAISSLALTQIVDIDDWLNACDDYGLIIDRARLYRIYSNNRKAIPKTLTSQVLNWCKAKLN